jgi:ribosomal protein S12 methylthiotransferase accessory factor
MNFNAERESQRLALAQELWHTAYAQFLRYGISSYRDVSRLDKIGIPVWITCRPLARTISINAGKSDSWLMAFAGAISEALEFWAAENPWGDSVVTSYEELSANKDCDLLPFAQLPFARDALIDSHIQLSWEKVERIQTDPEATPRLAWMPSDTIWLEQRSSTQFSNFQASSNGVAGGVQYEDAVLSALYELVERDGWTLHQVLVAATGEWPTKISLSGLPAELEPIVAAIRDAGLFPFVFDVTTTLGIPVFGCSIFDPAEDGAGTFGGYGCNLNPILAAKRALLEACQSRACYISGARDDLYRRDFLLLKRAEQKKAIATAEALPGAGSWAEFAEPYGDARFETISEELNALVHALRAKGISQLFVRQLAFEPFGSHHLSIVRVLAPQLEGVKFDEWRSNGRADNYVRERLRSDHLRGSTV